MNRFDLPAYVFLAGAAGMILYGAGKVLWMALQWAVG